eukprot:1936-Heterococcus_DN1.PRE.2
METVCFAAYIVIIAVQAERTTDLQYAVSCLAAEKQRVITENIVVVAGQVGATNPSVGIVFRCLHCGCRCTIGAVNLQYAVDSCFGAMKTVCFAAYIVVIAVQAERTTDLQYAVSCLAAEKQRVVTETIVVVAGQ